VVAKLDKNLLKAHGASQENLEHNKIYQSQLEAYTKINELNSGAFKLFDRFISSGEDPLVYQAVWADTLNKKHADEFAGSLHTHDTRYWRTSETVDYAQYLVGKDGHLYASEETEDITNPHYILNPKIHEHDEFYRKGDQVTEALLLNGEPSYRFELSNHMHPYYYKKKDTVVRTRKLGGKSASEFALATHNHDGTYYYIDDIVDDTETLVSRTFEGPRHYYPSDFSWRDHSHDQYIEREDAETRYLKWFDNAKNSAGVRLGLRRVTLTSGSTEATKLGFGGDVFEFSKIDREVSHYYTTTPGIDARFAPVKTTVPVSLVLPPPEDAANISLGSYSYRKYARSGYSEIYNKSLAPKFTDMHFPNIIAPTPPKAYEFSVKLGIVTSPYHQLTYSDKTEEEIFQDKHREILSSWGLKDYHYATGENVIWRPVALLLHASGVERSLNVYQDYKYPEEGDIIEKHYFCSDPVSGVCELKTGTPDIASGKYPESMQSECDADCEVHEVYYCSNPASGTCTLMNGRENISQGYYPKNMKAACDLKCEEYYTCGSNGTCNGPFVGEVSPAAGRYPSMAACEAVCQVTTYRCYPERTSNRCPEEICDPSRAGCYTNQQTCLTTCQPDMNYACSTDCQPTYCTVNNTDCFATSGECIAGCHTSYRCTGGLTPVCEITQHYPDPGEGYYADEVTCNDACVNFKCMARNSVFSCEPSLCETGSDSCYATKAICDSNCSVTYQCDPAGTLENPCKPGVCTPGNPGCFTSEASCRLGCVNWACVGKEPNTTEYYLAALTCNAIAGRPSEKPECSSHVRVATGGLSLTASGTSSNLLEESLSLFLSDLNKSGNDVPYHSSGKLEWGVYLRHNDGRVHTTLGDPIQIKIDLVFRDEVYGNNYSYVSDSIQRKTMEFTISRDDSRLNSPEDSRTGHYFFTGVSTKVRNNGTTQHRHVAAMEKIWVNGVLIASPGGEGLPSESQCIQAICSPDGSSCFSSEATCETFCIAEDYYECTETGCIHGIGALGSNRYSSEAVCNSSCNRYACINSRCVQQPGPVTSNYFADLTSCEQVCSGGLTCCQWGESARIQANNPSNTPSMTNEYFIAEVFKEGMPSVWWAQFMALDLPVGCKIKATIDFSYIQKATDPTTYQITETPLYESIEITVDPNNPSGANTNFRTANSSSYLTYTREKITGVTIEILEGCPGGSPSSMSLSLPELMSSEIPTGTFSTDADPRKWMPNSDVTLPKWLTSGIRNPFGYYDTARLPVNPQPLVVKLREDPEEGAWFRVFAKASTAEFWRPSKTGELQLAQIDADIAMLETLNATLEGIVIYSKQSLDCDDWQTPYDPTHCIIDANLLNPEFTYEDRYKFTANIQVSHGTVVPDNSTIEAVYEIIDNQTTAKYEWREIVSIPNGASGWSLLVDESWDSSEILGGTQIDLNNYRVRITLTPIYDPECPEILIEYNVGIPCIEDLNLVSTITDTESSSGGSVYTDTSFPEGTVLGALTIRFEYPPENSLKIRLNFTVIDELGGMSENEITMDILPGQQELTIPFSFIHTVNGVPHTPLGGSLQVIATSLTKTPLGYEPIERCLPVEDEDDIASMGCCLEPDHIRSEPWDPINKGLFKVYKKIPLGCNYVLNIYDCYGLLVETKQLVGPMEPGDIIRINYPYPYRAEIEMDDICCPAEECLLYLDNGSCDMTIDLPELCYTTTSHSCPDPQVCRSREISTSETSGDPQIIFLIDSSGSMYSDISSIGMSRKEFTFQSINSIVDSLEESCSPHYWVYTSNGNLGPSERVVGSSDPSDIKDGVWWQDGTHMHSASSMTQKSFEITDPANYPYSAVFYFTDGASYDDRYQSSTSVPSPNIPNDVPDRFYYINMIEDTGAKEAAESYFDRVRGTWPTFQSEVIVTNQADVITDILPEITSTIISEQVSYKYKQNMLLQGVSDECSYTLINSSGEYPMPIIEGSLDGLESITAPSGSAYIEVVDGTHYPVPDCQVSCANPDLCIDNFQYLQRSSATTSCSYILRSSSGDTSIIQNTIGNFTNLPYAEEGSQVRASDGSSWNISACSVTPPPPEPDCINPQVCWEPSIASYKQNTLVNGSSCTYLFEKSDNTLINLPVDSYGALSEFPVTWLEGSKIATSEVGLEWDINLCSVPTCQTPKICIKSGGGYEQTGVMNTSSTCAYSLGGISLSLSTSGWFSNLASAPPGETVVSETYTGNTWNLSACPVVCPVPQICVKTEELPPAQPLQFLIAVDHSRRMNYGGAPRNAPEERTFRRAISSIKQIKQAFANIPVTFTVFHTWGEYHIFGDDGQNVRITANNVPSTNFDPDSIQVFEKALSNDVIKHESHGRLSPNRILAKMRELSNPDQYTVGLYYTNTNTNEAYLSPSRDYNVLVPNLNQFHYLTMDAFVGSITPAHGYALDFFPRWKGYLNANGHLITAAYSAYTLADTLEKTTEIIDSITSELGVGGSRELFIQTQTLGVVDSLCSYQLNGTDLTISSGLMTNLTTQPVASSNQICYGDPVSYTCVPVSACSPHATPVNMVSFAKMASTLASSSVIQLEPGTGELEYEVICDDGAHITVIARPDGTFSQGELDRIAAIITDTNVCRVVFGDQETIIEACEEQDCANPNVCIREILPTPTMYSCNTGTYTCEEDALGTLTLSACQAMCVEPTPTMYSCNTATYTCELSFTGTQTLSECQEICVVPFEPLVERVGMMDYLLMSIDEQTLYYLEETWLSGTLESRHIVAIDANTGSERWVGSNSSGTPLTVSDYYIGFSIASNNSILVGTHEGGVTSLNSLNPTTGRAEWTKVITPSPLLVGENLIGNDSTFYENSGAVVWNSSSSFITATGKYLICAQGGDTLIYDTSTRTLIKTFTRFGIPWVIDDYAYTAVDKNRLLFVTKESSSYIYQRVILYNILTDTVEFDIADSFHEGNPLGQSVAFGDYIFTRSKHYDPHYQTLSISSGSIVHSGNIGVLAMACMILPDNKLLFKKRDSTSYVAGNYTRLFLQDYVTGITHEIEQVEDSYYPLTTIGGTVLSSSGDLFMVKTRFHYNVATSTWEPTKGIFKKSLGMSTPTSYNFNWFRKVAVDNQHTAWLKDTQYIPPTPTSLPFYTSLLSLTSDFEQNSLATPECDYVLVEVNTSGTTNINLIVGQDGRFTNLPERADPGSTYSIISGNSYWALSSCSADPLPTCSRPRICYEEENSSYRQTEPVAEPGTCSYKIVTQSSFDIPLTYQLSSQGYFGNLPETYFPGDMVVNIETGRQWSIPPCTSSCIDPDICFGDLGYEQLSVVDNTCSYSYKDSTGTIILHQDSSGNFTNLSLLPSVLIVSYIETDKGDSWNIPSCTSSQNFLDICVDITGPIIQNLNYLNGQRVSSQPITLTGEVIQYSDIWIDITVNGSDYSRVTGTSSGHQRIDFSKQIDLQYGVNTIYLYGEDYTGQDEKTLEIIYELDPEIVVDPIDPIDFCEGPSTSELIPITGHVVNVPGTNRSVNIYYNSTLIKDNVLVLEDNTFETQITITPIPGTYTIKGTVSTDTGGYAEDSTQAEFTTPDQPVIIVNNSSPVEVQLGITNKNITGEIIASSGSTAYYLIGDSSEQHSLSIGIFTIAVDVSSLPTYITIVVVETSENCDYAKLERVDFIAGPYYFCDPLQGGGCCVYTGTTYPESITLYETSDCDDACVVNPVIPTGVICDVDNGYYCLPGGDDANGCLNCSPPPPADRRYYTCGANGYCQLSETGEYTSSDCEGACETLPPVTDRKYACDVDGNCTLDMEATSPYYLGDPTCEGACPAPGPTPSRYTCDTLQGFCIPDPYGPYTENTCGGNPTCIVMPAEDYHYGCNSEDYCIQKPGPGSKDITCGGDCSVVPWDYHYGCNSEDYCIQKPGPGSKDITCGGACSITSGDIHYGCSEDDFCVVLPGSGSQDPTCGGACESLPTPDWHYGCSEDDRCVKLPGAGSKDSTCGGTCDPIPAYNWHYGCNSEDNCVILSGAGSQDPACGGTCNTVPPVRERTYDCNLDGVCVYESSGTGPYTTTNCDNACRIPNPNREVYTCSESGYCRLKSNVSSGTGTYYNSNCDNDCPPLPTPDNTLYDCNTSGKCVPTVGGSYTDSSCLGECPVPDAPDCPNLDICIESTTTPGSNTSSSLQVIFMLDKSGSMIYSTLSGGDTRAIFARNLIQSVMDEFDQLSAEIHYWSFSGSGTPGTQQGTTDSSQVTFNGRGHSPQGLTNAAFKSVIENNFSVIFYITDGEMSQDRYSSSTQIPFEGVAPNKFYYINMVDINDTRVGATGFLNRVKTNYSYMEFQVLVTDDPTVMDSTIRNMTTEAISESTTSISYKVQGDTIVNTACDYRIGQIAISVAGEGTASVGNIPVSEGAVLNCQGEGCPYPIELCDEPPYPTEYLWSCNSSYTCVQGPGGHMTESDCQEMCYVPKFTCNTGTYTCEVGRTGTSLASCQSTCRPASYVCPDPDICSTEEITGYAASGYVRDLANSNPISGANVAYSGGSTVTNSSGYWSFPSVPPTSITFTGSKSGYINGSVTHAFSGDKTNLIIFLNKETPSAFTVSGVVVDASNNARISGANVSYSGGSTTANSSGEWTFTTVPSGTHTFSASASGFVSGSKQEIITANKSGVVIALSRVMASDEVKAILTWGAEPRDLDSHFLSQPIPGGVESHIYYSNKGSAVSEPFVRLDVDDVSGYGPETVHIAKTGDRIGTYFIYVWGGTPGYFDDSGSTAAQVEIVTDGASTAIQRPPVPSGVTTPRYWYVFNIMLDGSIQIVNRLQSISPTLHQAVGSPMGLSYTEIPVDLLASLYHYQQTDALPSGAGTCSYSIAGNNLTQSGGYFTNIGGITTSSRITVVNVNVPGGGTLTYPIRECSSPTDKYDCINDMCVITPTGTMTHAECISSCTLPADNTWSCNTSTYTCIEDPAGTQTEAECLVTCEAPPVTPKYNCTAGGDCIRDDITGSMTYSECNSTCNASPLTEYLCQITTGICIRDPINGTLTHGQCLSTCQAPEPGYSCNPVTGVCEPSLSGTYTAADCDGQCQIGTIDLIIQGKINIGSWRNLKLVDADCLPHCGVDILDPSTNTRRCACENAADWLIDYTIRPSSTDFPGVPYLFPMSPWVSLGVCEPGVAPITGYTFSWHTTKPVGRYLQQIYSPWDLDCIRNGGPKFDVMPQFMSPGYPTPYKINFTVNVNERTIVPEESLYYCDVSGGTPRCVASETRGYQSLIDCNNTCRVIEEDELYYCNSQYTCVQGPSGHSTFAECQSTCYVPRYTCDPTTHTCKVARTGSSRETCESTCGTSTGEDLTRVKCPNPDLIYERVEIPPDPVYTNFTVRVYKPKTGMAGDMLAPGASVTISGPSPSSKLTGSTGTALFQNVLEGRYTLDVTLSGYSPETLVRRFLLENDGVVINVYLSEDPYNVLTNLNVIVTDSEGNPISEIPEITVTGPGGFSSTVWGKTYTFVNLEPGTYTIVVKSQNESPVTTSVVITGSSATQEISIAMSGGITPPEPSGPPLYVIRASDFDVSSRVIPNLTVDVTGPGGYSKTHTNVVTPPPTSPPQTSVSRSGVYTAWGHAPGYYSCRITDRWGNSDYADAEASDSTTSSTIANLVLFISTHLPIEGSYQEYSCYLYDSAGNSGPEIVDSAPVSGLSTLKVTVKDGTTNTVLYGCPVNVQKSSQVFSAPSTATFESFPIGETFTLTVSKSGYNTYVETSFTVPASASGSIFNKTVYLVTSGGGGGGGTPDPVPNSCPNPVLCKTVVGGVATYTQGASVANSGCRYTLDGANLEVNGAAWINGSNGWFTNLHLMTEDLYGSLSTVQCFTWEGWFSTGKYVGNYTVPSCSASSEFTGYASDVNQLASTVYEYTQLTPISPDSCCSYSANAVPLTLDSGGYFNNLPALSASYQIRTVKAICNGAYTNYDIRSSGKQQYRCTSGNCVEASTGSSHVECISTCVANVEEKYYCDISDSYSCKLGPTGTMTLSQCQSMCTAPPAPSPKYICNTDTFTCEENILGVQTEADCQATCIAPSPPSGSPTYRALLVASGEYDDPSQNLPISATGVERIRAVLVNQNTPYQITVKSPRITSPELDAAFSVYSSDSSITSQDVFLFYWSGHGASVEGNSVLATAELAAYSVERLRTKLSAIPGKKIVLIEACQSSGFSQLSLEDATWINPELYTEQFSKSAGFNQGVLDIFGTSSGKFSMQDSSDQEFSVIAASSPGENAYGSQTYSGFMSFAIADGLGASGILQPTSAIDNTFNADIDGNGEITLSELYVYAKPLVMQLSVNRQNMVTTYGDIVVATCAPTASPSSLATPNYTPYLLPTEVDPDFIKIIQPGLPGETYYLKCGTGNAIEIVLDENGDITDADKELILVAYLEDGMCGLYKTPGGTGEYRDLSSCSVVLMPELCYTIGGEVQTVIPGTPNGSFQVNCAGDIFTVTTDSSGDLTEISSNRLENYDLSSCMINGVLFQECETGPMVNDCIIPQVCASESGFRQTGLVDISGGCLYQITKTSTGEIYTLMVSGGYLTNLNGNPAVTSYCYNNPYRCRIEAVKSYITEGSAIPLCSVSVRYDCISGICEESSTGFFPDRNSCIASGCEEAYVENGVGSFEISVKEVTI